MPFQPDGSESLAYLAGEAPLAVQIPHSYELLGNGTAAFDYVTRDCIAMRGASDTQEIDSKMAVGAALLYAQDRLYQMIRELAALDVRQFERANMSRRLAACSLK